MIDTAGMVRTAAGRAWQSKVQAGLVEAQYTAIVFGAGVASGDPAELTQLVDERLSIPVQPTMVISDTEVLVSGVLTNAGLAVGFGVTEIGAKAIDPDLGEIVVARAEMLGDGSGVIPSGSSSTLLEQTINLIVATKDAAIIKFSISGTDGHVSWDAFRRDQQRQDDAFAAMLESYSVGFLKPRNFTINDAEVVLIEYDPQEWNPNAILKFGEELPVPADTTVVSLAIQEATDPLTDASDTINAYVWDVGNQQYKAASSNPITVKNGFLFMLYPSGVDYYWNAASFNLLNAGATDLSDLYADQQRQDTEITSLWSEKADKDAHITYYSLALPDTLQGRIKYGKNAMGTVFVAINVARKDGAAFATGNTYLGTLPEGYRPYNDNFTQQHFGAFSTPTNSATGIIAPIAVVQGAICLAAGSVTQDCKVIVVTFSASTL